MRGRWIGCVLVVATGCDRPGPEPQRPAAPEATVSARSRGSTDRSSARQWRSSQATYAWAKQTWESQGRRWLHRFAGIAYDGDRWSVDPDWPHAPRDVGSKAYFTQYTTLAAVHMAAGCDDVALADDVARFFLAYSERFTTLGALRAGSAGAGNTATVRERGPAHHRTLPWVQYRKDEPFIRECDLCMAQALYPAARLLRLIAQTDAAARTDAMRRFAALYGPLVLRDHLLRFLHDLRRPLCGTKKISQVELWKRERDDPSCRVLFTDREMWLVATAAELLGANEADPGIVTIRESERASLLDAIAAGVAVVRQRVRRIPARGGLPETSSWFEGDYTDRDEWAYAGYAGADYPLLADRVDAPIAGWDVGHAHRIPLFLRALWDNAAVTGVDFPDERDLGLAARQLVHRVFYGEHRFPLLRNFFNGQDGWFRVGFHGVEFGYPPAPDCDASVRTRPCLNSIAWQGWGRVAFAEPALDDVLDAVLDLAARTDADTIAFRDRYFEYEGEPFRFGDPSTRGDQTIALWWIATGSPERLAGCAAASSAD